MSERTAHGAAAELLVAFYEPQILLEAPAHLLAGRFPHLRLVCLLPSQAILPLLEVTPPHVRERLLLDPPEDLACSGRLRALLTADVSATAIAFPAVELTDIVMWGELAAVYDRWLDSDYLPLNSGRANHTPEALFPRDFGIRELAVEFVGSCGARVLLDAVPDVQGELRTRLTAIETVQNHPQVAEPAPAADVTVVVPPLRYMHPASLDDWIAHPDPERLFTETCAHMRTYLDSVARPRDGRTLFVLGFIEPVMNPTGLFFPARELSNFKFFVRSLNDELVRWCEQRTSVHFVDNNEIASIVGKRGVDDGMTSYFAHRATLDPENADNHDRPAPTVEMCRSFDCRTHEYSVAVLREILARAITMAQTGRVKAVIFDLDHTLWRGLASDREIGAWTGRPQGLVEIIKLLKRRGIFVAVASKNDERYLREHWDEILVDWAYLPLGMALSLEDFDAVRIDFRPKPETVAEIVAELGILPESVVFVDDNPLEREQVQAAFPGMRVLGAELNYVRRELLHSPFTQAETLTAEDALRAATVRRRAELGRQTASGTAGEFLSSLGLTCELTEVADPDAPAGRRALQLINKTNQWNLNGARIAEPELREAMAGGTRLFVAGAGDAGSSYGIVAAALVDPSVARVTHLVVSCRVIGMGIDDAFMHRLLRICGELELAYADTGRNRAAADFLTRNELSRGAGETPRLSELPAPEHIRLDPVPAS